MQNASGMKYSELFKLFGYKVKNKQISVNHVENHDIVIWGEHIESGIPCGFFFTEDVGWSMQASADNVIFETMPFDSLLNLLKTITITPVIER